MQYIIVPFCSLENCPLQLADMRKRIISICSENGITEGHQFQMRRVTLFISSSIANRIKFLTEIEFEDGAKEISIEFASLDIEFTPLLNFRGGIVLNPIGAFNQNHDGPKWEFVDRPISATQMLPATWSNVGFGLYGKKFTKNWVYAYEAYLTNGFDDRIISNQKTKLFCRPAKKIPNGLKKVLMGSMLLTGKIAVRNSKIGEIGSFLYGWCI